MGFSDGERKQPITSIIWNKTVDVSSKAGLARYVGSTQGFFR